MFPEHPPSPIKKEIASLLEQDLGLSQGEIYRLFERPKNEDHGHLALPLFRFCQEHKKVPHLFAEEFAKKIENKKFPQIQEARAFSGFVNLKLSIPFLRSHLEKLIQKDTLAQWSLTNPPHWLIDFASPNVAKYMNVGHLRATVIGQALVNLARAFGYRVTSLNHLGDWGTQFGKLLWAYQNWSHDYNFDKNPLDSLVALYVRFHEEATLHPKRNEEAALLFKQLESGDESLKILWEKFIKISLKDYQKYWDALNVKHDKVLGESFYIPFFEDLKKILTKKNLLETSEGAEVVFLNEDSPPCLIQKKDGASTYAARDLCSALYRFNELKSNKNIYVTGSDQKLHFQQIFQTLEKMGITCDKSKHVYFGMYRFKDSGKMSSRGGKAVYLQDVLVQAQEKVQGIIKDRDIENKEQVAKQVGIGAIIFNDLMNDCVKDVDFDWARLLDFEGRTGPFVQYTHVRCLSLIDKYKGESKKAFEDLDFFPKKDEERVIWKLLSFEESVYQSFLHFKPHILACYLLELSKDFNRFYSMQKILGTNRERDLIILVESVMKILKRGLEILNIPIPSKM